MSEQAPLRSRRGRNARTSASDTPAALAPNYAPVATAAPNAGPRIGWDEHRPSLNVPPTPLRTLTTHGDVLPELEEAPSKKRSLWRHPASLVSIITTLLALITMGVLMFMGVFGTSSQATNAVMERAENAFRVQWTGPDVPYQLVIVDGPAAPEVDASQYVVGTEAWIALGTGLIDENTCIVVRPVSENPPAITLDRAGLEAQGATAVCVPDATTADDAAREDSAE